MSCVAHGFGVGACSAPRPHMSRSAGVPGSRGVCSSRASASSNVPSTSTSTKASNTTHRVRDGWYKWRGHRVHFERGGADPSTAKRHLVFLHGFGVGSFHYEDQLDNLSSDGTTCVWALDFCGQGKSWPCRDDDGADDNSSNYSPPDYLDTETAAPPGFRYSVDTWRDQAEYFLSQIVKAEGGAFVAGNSLGGFVGTYLTASKTNTNASPPLVRGLLLLNATPFWGFVPSDTNGIARRLTPWDGSLPAPGWIKAPFKLYWNSFRSIDNVKGLLSLVYADGKDRVDDTLVKNIIAPTNRQPALSAFCSVVWSPKSAMDFDDMLSAIKNQSGTNRTQIALVYGKDDPWVVPLWGQKLKRQVPRVHYYELPGVGHCPAHEAPEITNCVISKWIQWCDDQSENKSEKTNPPGQYLIDGAPRNVFEKIAEWRESV